MRNSAPLRSANFTGSTTAAAVLLLCCCCAAGAGAGAAAAAAAAAAGVADAAAAAAAGGVSAAPQWTESSAEIPMADRRWSSLPLSVPFPRRPNPTTVTSSLRPRNEGTPAAASKSARVQPFKCSQQVARNEASPSANPYNKKIAASGGPSMA
jgi:hypothetical protein